MQLYYSVMRVVSRLSTGAPTLLPALKQVMPFRYWPPPHLPTAPEIVPAAADRGFSVAHVVDELVVPLRVRSDGEIDTRTDEVHHFRCAAADICCSG